MITHVQRKASDFRSDIVGLRALAVSLVLLNHFGIPGFGFGFIGVDIFFVISGYLITRVLYKEYISSAEGNPAKSSISLSRFYLRRARRLLPAALVVILVVNIVSFFTSNPVARAELLSNSKWATLFLANVAFLRSGSDYFQQGNEPSMLLHFWSLSVEEQFYLIWPILFLFAASYQRLRLRGKFVRFNVRLLVLIFATTLTSFCFLIYNFNQNKTEAYFAIFTRAWELGVGSFFGILAFSKSKQTVISRTEKYLPLFLALVFTSLVISTDNWAYFIAFSVLATGFWLYAGENCDQRSVLGNSSIHNISRRFVIYIGNISYSLYLVHWPIFIIANRLELAEDFIMRISLFPLSVLVAHWLWKYVEVPFQRIPLPKKSIVEERLFHLIKTKRAIILSISVLIFGSLYMVTYPTVTSKVFSADANLSRLIQDPNLKFFSNYQSQLTSGLADLPSIFTSETKTPEELTGQELISLEDEVIRELKSGLAVTQLSQDQAKNFISLAKDVSPFQLTRCATRDTEIPPECSIGNNSSDAKKVALVGDSKMEAIAQPIIEYFTESGWRVTPMSMDGCHMSNPSNKYMSNCVKRTEWILKHLETNSYDLVISAEFPDVDDRNFFTNYFATLQKYSGKVIIIQSSPQVNTPNQCVNADYTYARDCFRIASSFTGKYSQTQQLVRSLASSNTFIVESQKWICIDLECPLTSDGLFVTRDGSHLSYSYVKKIAPLIRGKINEIIQKQ